MQNKRLVELDELFDAGEIALLACQGRLLHLQGGSGTVDALDHDFLGGNRKFVISRFGYGNCVELHAHPVFQALLRAKMLAVREACQLDRAAHIARIARGSRELVNRFLAARDNGRGYQGHSPADHIHRNHVQALALIGRQLPKVSSEQIRERRGSIDAFVPPGKRLVSGRLNNRRPHDCDG